MTGQGPGFAGQNTSLVGQKRKKGRESGRPGQALARQNPKFVGRLTDDWLLFAGLRMGTYGHCLRHVFSIYCWVFKENRPLPKQPQ